MAPGADEARATLVAWIVGVSEGAPCKVQVRIPEARGGQGLVAVLSKPTQRRPPGP